MKDFHRPIPGNYMRWKEAVWVVKSQHKGVLHIEMLKTGEPDKLRLMAWQEGCANETIQMIQDPAANLPDNVKDLANIQFAALPISMQKDITWKKRYIQAFLDPVKFYADHLPNVAPEQRRIPRSLSPAQIEPFFDHVASTAPQTVPPEERPASTTFRAWLKRWERYQDWNMMASRFDRQGPNERTIIIGQVQRLIDGAIKRIWMKSNKFPKADVCDEVATRLTAWNDAHPAAPGLAVSRRQIERYIDEVVDKLDMTAARLGNRIAKKRFDPVMQGPIPDHIFDLVEVDHTHAKVAVCDDETGHELGRPWITTALDKRSRMPAGIHVHFEGQSLNAVMQALRNTMQPKHYLKKLLPDLDYDYTVCGRPIEFFFDRGDDFDNEHVQEVGLNFDIVTKYAPGDHPEYKASLERFFGTLHQKVALNLPGARPRVTAENKKSRTEPAKIAFSDFYERLWRWVALEYAKSYHEGIGDIPLDRWRQGEAVQPPRPPFSAKKTDNFLMRVVRCQATRDGVQYAGLMWNGDVIKKIRSHPSFRKGQEILVRIDDSNLGRAFVTDPATRSLEPLDPVLTRYMPGTTWFQHSLAVRALVKKKVGTYSERALMDAKERRRSEALALLTTKSTKSKTRERLARQLGIGTLAPAGDSLGYLHPDSTSTGAASRTPRPDKVSEDSLSTSPKKPPQEQTDAAAAQKSASNHPPLPTPIELPDHEQYAQDDT